MDMQINGITYRATRTCGEAVSVYEYSDPGITRKITIVPMGDTQQETMETICAAILAHQRIESRQTVLAA